MELKVITCDCGEDVFENDYGNDPEDGNVWCINCGESYPITDLKTQTLPDITN